MNLHSLISISVVFLMSACTSAPTSHLVATKPTDSTVALEAPMPTEQPRSAQIELKTSKNQKLATIHLKEIPEGLLVLLETHELANGSYQIALSEDCLKNSKENTSSHKVIRKFRIQRSSLSDEFKLVGFKLNQEGQEKIQGKAMNLVSVPQKTKPVILACSQIQ